LTSLLLLAGRSKDNAVVANSSKALMSRATAVILSAAKNLAIERIKPPPLYIAPTPAVGGFSVLFTHPCAGGTIILPSFYIAPSPVLGGFFFALSILLCYFTSLNE